MTNQELRDKLDELRQLPHETEWVEFKEAKKDYDFDKLGKYFSALENFINKALCFTESIKNISFNEFILIMLRKYEFINKRNKIINKSRHGPQQKIT